MGLNASAYLSYFEVKNSPAESLNDKIGICLFENLESNMSKCYMLSAFHKTHFQSSFTENHGVIVLIYICFTIALNSLEIFKCF